MGRCQIRGAFDVLLVWARCMRRLARDLGDVLLLRVANRAPQEETDCPCGQRIRYGAVAGCVAVAVAVDG